MLRHERFSGRLQRKDKEISEALKLFIKDFWTNNMHFFPDQRDIVRRMIGSQNHDPHAKHFLDTT